MARRAFFPALEAFASETIGDGGRPNLYFVTDQGIVITITRDFARAYDEWDALVLRVPRRECALEDRQQGVLACVEPESDEPGARLVVIDDAYELRKRS